LNPKWCTFLQNNNIGIRGIAPKVELYPIKVLDRYGEGSIEDVVTGIDWCIDN
jgi:subtilisin family serine protease